MSSKKTIQIDSDIPVNTNYLHSTVKFMTDLKPSRNHENLISLNKNADFIEKKFAEYGYKPFKQKYTFNELEYKNIITSIGPKDAPRFIVGAHYDVYGNQPGADDNASGVAGLLGFNNSGQINPAYNNRYNGPQGAAFSKICDNFGTVLLLMKFSGTLFPPCRSAAPEFNRSRRLRRDSI